MRNTMLAAMLSSFILFNAGCDAFDDGRTTVEGTVINSVTGAPISGVNVILTDNAGMGTCGRVDAAVSDAQGRYRVSLVPGRSVNALILMANGTCYGRPFEYDETYSGYYNPGIPKGETHSVVIALPATVPL
jgi:hypothetical protein